MQIGTNQFYDTNATQLGKLATQADTLNTQIATGKKFTAPSQDVVAYNRLTAIKQTNADSTAYASNVSLAQSLLQQSDTTLTAVGNQLQRAAELTTQAANGTLNDANRKTIAIELQSIRDDLVGLAGTTDARGQPLFGAASGGAAVVQAADGTVSFGGTGEISPIPVADGTDIHATDSAQRVFGNIPASGGGTTDVFSVLSSLISALNAGGDVSAATGSAADGLKGALNQVSNVQGSVGARAARLDIVASQATDAAAARETDRVALEDTDVSTAITELQKTMTVLQATQASFTKLGQLSLFTYLR
ncbi:flagellin N-terminal helical domain-containing protein [Sphingomonas psychrolutea]|uniref:Flagellin n=1 Tax=Sphingomonas psychrolutea TaxID=1259676 RepID=A0ABQ1GKN4_9SPHN|nr:flagellin [Sphingomonas psychrolutea]GGA45448.1 flagellar hook-associated protein 3 [Sphingomonas psychrolutea]